MSPERPDARFVARIIELSEGAAKVRLLHEVVNHHFDLKPLDRVVTIAVDEEAAGGLASLAFKDEPSVIDIEGGKIVRASTVEEAGLRPAQKVVLELSNRVAFYGAIHVAQKYLPELKKNLLSMKFRWTHQAQGQLHEMTLKEALVFGEDHCSQCGKVILLQRSACGRCAELGLSPVWRVAYDLLGMLTLYSRNIDSGGSIETSTNASGQVQVVCKSSTQKTTVYEIQGILEKMATGGAKV